MIPWMTAMPWILVLSSCAQLFYVFAESNWARFGLSFLFGVLMMAALDAAYRAGAKC